MQLVQWNLEGCFCAFYASVFGRHILHIENFQLYKVNIAGDYFCQIIRIDCNGAWIKLRALFSCQLEFSYAETGFITVEDWLLWCMDKTAGVGVSLTAWWQDFQVDNIFRSTIFSNRFYIRRGYSQLYYSQIGFIRTGLIALIVISILAAMGLCRSDTGQQCTDTCHGY